MRSIKKFIIYFPVILVTLQVLANLWALADWDSYASAGWYLNLALGTNVMFCMFLLAFTFAFNFCTISRAAAIAEMAFAVNYVIVQQDNLYNILFQVIVGVAALVVTYLTYIKKFPMCNLSLVHKFFAYLTITGSCSRALDRWDNDVKSMAIKKHYNVVRNNRH